jgi:hypothetical protein
VAPPRPHSGRRHHHSNAKVRLETDTLDAGGKVIETTTGYVDSVAPLRGWIDQSRGDFVRWHGR